MPGAKREITPPRSKRRRLDSPPARPEKPQHSQTAFTLYSWNINGIGPFVQRPITAFFKLGEAERSCNGPKSADIDTRERPVVSLRDFLRRHSWPTLLFLQEVKINPEDSATLSAVGKAVRRQLGEARESPSYRAHFCLPSDNFNAHGFGRKVYGVCSIIREDFYEKDVHVVRPVSWDQEGRFLVIETQPSGDEPKLAIINVYAVNGTDNPYKSPLTGRPSGTRHDRKLEVHALLQAECQKLEGDGFGCIIAGDLNIARAAIDGYPNLRTFPAQHSLNRADFEARFISTAKGSGDKETGDQEAIRCLSMIDTFRYLYPGKHGYTYDTRTKKFGDSCDRVDLILVSKGLEQCLCEAGLHETPGDRAPSDHVPLYACLDFEKPAGRKAS